MKNLKPKDRVLTLMRCWAILIPSLFFSYATDTVHMTFICLAASVICFTRKAPISINLRSVIYTIVLALTVIVLTNTLFKIESRFYLTPSEMGVPAALVFAMALLFYDDRASFSASILILVIFSIMMCGDITDPHVVRNLPIPPSMGKLDVVKTVYIFSLLLCVIPFFYLTNRSQNSLKIMKRPSIKTSFIKYSIALFSFALVFIFYTPTQRTVVPLTKEMESRMVRTLSQWRFNKKNTAFQKQVDLRDSYFNLDLDALGLILIRIESNRTPGYVRSRVYETYANGIWQSQDKPIGMELLTEEDHEYSFNTYSFKGLEQVDRKELDKIQIYYSGNFRVDNVLHQGKSRYLEMTCEILNQSQSGSVSGTNLDFSGGVTIYNEKNWSSEDAFDGPKVNELNEKIYLAIDNVERAYLNRFIQENDALKHDESDPKILAFNIAKFFNDNFTYKLGVSLDKSKDVVYGFLTNPNREGHCEYFATAAVMMLRSQKVPARYVTGFYCQEQHPNGEYYLGRSKDLHAWVEFYDYTTGNWQLLEPTPASGMPSGNSNFNFFTSTWDAITKRWQDVLSNIVRGYFAESIVLFLKSILDLVFWCFSSVPKAIITSFLIYLYLKRRKKKSKKAPLSKEVEIIHKDIQKVLTRLSKIKEFNIHDSMTLRDIVDQLKKAEKPQLASYINCLKEYESLRYNSKIRTAESINAMRTQIASTLKTRI